MKYKRDLITTGEAAKEMGVHPVTIWRAVRDGLLEAHKTPGGHNRIKLEELRLFIENGKRLSEEI